MPQGSVQHIPVDTTNVQLVGRRQDDEIIVGMPKSRMTPEEALVQAAWLVALADPGRRRFPMVLEAVLNA